MLVRLLSTTGGRCEPNSRTCCRRDEPELIGLANGYEQATRVRIPPQFIRTIGDALFPGVPNPARLRAAPKQATDVQRHLVVRLRKR